MSTIYLYVMEEFSHEERRRPNAIKIGISRNPLARFKQLQTANKNRLELRTYVDLCTVSREKAQWVEDAFHELLSEDKLQGEWFKYSKRTGAVLAILASMSDIDRIHRVRMAG